MSSVQVHVPEPRGAPGASGPERLSAYRKATLVRGQPTTMSCVDIDGRTFELAGRALRTLRLEDEWFDDVPDPEGVVAAIRASPHLGVDLFTFRQRVPDTTPSFPYAIEWEDLAVLRVHSYEHWLRHQASANARSRVRKAERAGIVVREVPYDDEFVVGMTRIFNETPVRQGRPFWHYGKSFATVKEQFARFIHRETMLGAYLGEEMIGVVMLSDAGRYALPSQILSSVKHRDKGTNNALVAKAVEVCAERGLPYLVYFHWAEGSLTEFKRRCGFERMRVPRYVVPLTTAGRVALRYGAHRGLAEALPPRLREGLKGVRRRWLEHRHAAGD